MRKDIVEVSTEIALSGLYMTPDIWFFGHFISGDDLRGDVQIIHDTQPLTSSYATFGDTINEKYHVMAAENPSLTFCDYLMAMCALCSTQWQINRALNAIVEVAIAIFLKTTNSKDNAKYPRVIPHELEEMRLDAGWKFNRDTFHQMFLAEPWLSWTELMRGQFYRTRHVISTGQMMQNLQEFRQSIDRIEDRVPPDKDPKQREEAKRALKRAVKLYDRMYGLNDVRRLLKGAPTVIEGRQYNYSLTFNRGTLFQETIIRDTGMSPTWLDIQNKNGDELGAACLFFEDTAILDHLLNVKLHSSNPETELDMIRGFHITKTTSHFYRDPILPDLKGIHDPVTAPLTTVDNVMAHAYSNMTQKICRRVMHGPLLWEATAALQKILRFPKGYKTISQQCNQQGLWAFLDGNPEALSVIDGKLNAGLFA